MVESLLVVQWVTSSGLHEMSIGHSVNKNVIYLFWLISLQVITRCVCLFVFVLQSVVTVREQDELGHCNDSQNTSPSVIAKRRPL